jgi:mannose-6-phosphate isomerase-like protein (cupin superfamily)
MTTVSEYIGSGMLEQYVLGLTSPEESMEVEMRAAANPAIRHEIDAISEAMESYAMDHAIEPDSIIKPFLLATIDYTERLKSGEPATVPPTLNENSAIEDYAAWLDRADMIAPGTENIHAKIIGYTPEAVTAIIWIKDFAPQEVHDHEIEKFLIIEGTCDIIVGDMVHQLGAGDYFPIPLHKKHLVKVTSSFPCKIILQRMAA